MQQRKKTPETEIAKLIVDKAEKALTAQSDFEWWSVLLESFYGSTPRKPDRKQRY